MVMACPVGPSYLAYFGGSYETRRWFQQFRDAPLPIDRPATPEELFEDSCRHADFEFAAGVRHRHARRQRRELEVACMDAIENKRPLPRAVLVRGRSGDLYRVTHTLDADR